MHNFEFVYDIPITDTKEGEIMDLILSHLTKGFNLTANTLQGPLAARKEFYDWAMKEGDYGCALRALIPEGVNEADLYGWIAHLDKKGILDAEWKKTSNLAKYLPVKKPTIQFSLN